MDSVTREDLTARARQSEDPNFRAKFVDLPHHLDVWLAGAGGLEGKRILDFGCGGGVTAAALALTRKPRLVLGTDINDEHKGCRAELERHLGVVELPSNLVFESVAPGSLPAMDGFDLIYSWSVFEHVDQSLFGELMRRLQDKLVADGHLFVQIAPLYFSSEGSHLMRFGLTNWEHLTLQLNRLRARVFGAEGADRAVKEAEWSCFETLNRMTVDGIVEGVVAAGFELTRLYKTVEEKDLPAGLDRIYSAEVLKTNQMVALFRKT